MAALFFYGTLRSVPLLEIVLAKPAAALSIQPAELPDHAVYLVEGQAFPFVTAEVGGHAEGLLVDGLTDDDIARLDFYEGFAEFALAEADVVLPDGTRRAVPVYYPANSALARGPRFDLADWERRWGQMALGAAEEYMGYFGTPEADRADKLYPFMLSRADAALRGRATPAPQLRRALGADDVQVHTRPGGYRGFFRLDPLRVSHRRFDGTMTVGFDREIFVAYDAALVLPYDPALDTVLLIEQVRFGPMGRSDPYPSLLEPVAGLVDAGESPEDCARREMIEETGVPVRDLRPMMRGYPSPGYSSEYFHCFLALCDLSGRGDTVSGLADENEDIRSHVLPFDTALALCDTGEINTMPLAAMLFWLDRHRGALREAG